MHSQLSERKLHQSGEGLSRSNQSERADRHNRRAQKAVGLLRIMLGYGDGFGHAKDRGRQTLKIS